MSSHPMRPRSVRRLIVAAAGAFLLVATAATPILAASGKVLVTSAADSGPGTLRAALAAADADGSIGQIVILGSVDEIQLQSPLTYSGSQALRIVGNDTTIDASSAVGDAFFADGGASLWIGNLTVVDADESAIQMKVPSGATGVLRLKLTGVSVVDAGEHGVWIYDQELDTEAGIAFEIIGSSFIHNGYDASDFDGVRGDEGGLGSVSLYIRGSSFIGNGADGLEMDEQQDGSVWLDIASTHFDENGPKDPADLDDGIDIDEADAGDIAGVITSTTANDNFDQGIDLNENHAGDLRVTLSAVTANGNGAEGIDLEEDDDFDGGGDLVAGLRAVTASGNGHAAETDGIKIEEDGVGSLIGRVVATTANDNWDHGSSFEQQASGVGDTGEISLVAYEAIGNGGDPWDTSGTVTVIETP